MGSKYRIVGISEPGLINVMVDGHFRDVRLHEVDDTILDKLHKDKCPYVQLTPEGVMANNPGSPEIKVITIESNAIQPKVVTKNSRRR